MRDVDVIIADDVRAALSKALQQLQLAAGEMATLTYWSDYRGQDGTSVDGFVPGYQIGAVSRPPRAHWIRLRVPGIGFVRFWPRFDEREASRLIATFASAQFGTFALTKAD